jgi:ABC-type thiamin/hydroxymethylpyrimidine transport system permease subunit
MSQANVGIAILVGLVLGISILVHWRIRSIIPASLIAGLLAAVAFMLIDTIVHGQLEKLAPVAFIVALLWGVGGAFAVGLIFVGFRKEKRQRR